MRRVIPLREQRHCPIDIGRLAKAKLSVSTNPEAQYHYCNIICNRQTSIFHWSTLIGLKWLRKLYQNHWQYFAIVNLSFGPFWGTQLDGDWYFTTEWSIQYSCNGMVVSQDLDDYYWYLAGMFVSAAWPTVTILNVWVWMWCHYNHKDQPVLWIQIEALRPSHLNQTQY